MALFPILLLTLIIAGQADAQNILNDKPRRGHVPKSDAEIIKILNEITRARTESTILVSLRLMTCKAADNKYRFPIQEKISKYFAPYYPGTENLNNLSEIAPLDRLKLAPGYVGYLIQGVGPELSSVIDLWAYDLSKQTWLKPVEVSWFWGDAGEYICVDSLVTDVNRDGAMDIVKRGKRGEIKMGLESLPRVDFDATVVQIFTHDEFRNYGRVTAQFRKKLAAIDNDYEKCLQRAAH